MCVGGSHIFWSVLCFHINMFFVFLLLLSKYAESFSYICVSELCFDV